MLQLQVKDHFLWLWVKSAVLQPHSLLCGEWHHLPEVKGSGIVSFDLETHTDKHTNALPRARKNKHRLASLECTSTGVYQHAHPSSTHSRAFTKPQVYDRWRRLIASALHHEWQQEVMNALLYGGRGNGHVGYLSSSLKPFPVSHLHRISIPVLFLLLFRNMAAHLSVGFLISFSPTPPFVPPFSWCTFECFKWTLYMRPLERGHF